ncbi:MAG: hypothetical protein HC927_00260 [Deltaproteobacteria bacterium]|nr:hypothetical protein [Deltaproteobacteria bacterium]
MSNGSAWRDANATDFPAIAHVGPPLRGNLIGPLKQLEEVKQGFNGYSWCEEAWDTHDDNHHIFGTCTGVLLDGDGPPQLLTVAHCLSTLASHTVVFDHDAKNAKNGWLTRHYGATFLNPENSLANIECVETCDQEVDFAIFRIDLPSPRRGMTLSSISPNAKPFALYHPLGLPLKRSPRVKVEATDSKGRPTMKIDNGAGGSGGAVVDRPGELIGILTGNRAGPGELDYHVGNGCYFPAQNIPQAFIPTESIQSRMKSQTCTLPSGLEYCSKH